MDCFKKTRNISIGKFTFGNQKELNETIKRKLKECPRNVEIEDELFLTVINELHSDVKKRNFKVKKIKVLDWSGQTGRWEFCRERFRGGIFVIGYFEPINEWHGVTLYPHQRKNKGAAANLISALRQKWSETAKKRDPYIRCEECDGINPQLHHDNISFKEIAEQCMKYFSVEELENGVGDDWWLHEQESDAIPDDHPAVQEMLRLHSQVKYRWLCHLCHQKNHGNNS